MVETDGVASAFFGNTQGVLLVDTPTLSDNDLRMNSTNYLQYKPEQSFLCEWLVTNGIGGYASATIAGVNSRRYHGLLVGSFPPPLGRQVVLSRIDEEIRVGDDSYPLACSEYDGGVIHPDGFRYLSSFWLDLGIPTFEYRFSNCVIRKQVWLERGQNTVYIMYDLREGPGDVVLLLRPFCAFRGYHGPLRKGGDGAFAIVSLGDSVLVSSAGVPYTLRIACDGAEFQNEQDWYWRYLYRMEKERGLDFLEDLFTPGYFSLSFRQGCRTVFVATTEPSFARLQDALRREKRRRRSLVKQEADGFRRQLLLAADQFIVDIPGPKPKKGIIAGYHWFGEWGRDTMISIPGLLLSTRRFSEARKVLLRWAEALECGMLPNRFNDDGGAEYNSVDAVLWLFECLQKYVSSSGDESIIKQLFPRLEKVIEKHIAGTRFGISTDSDGLLRIAEPRTQLTWMDACVNGQPVTPRSGKAVEVNALWYNALSLMSPWAIYAGQSPEKYETLASHCGASFRRKFWYAVGSYLYDVIDAPGNDASIRPNQIMAVSLTYSPLDTQQQKSVVDVVEKYLLTPYGLRTLSEDHPSYVGTYRGSPQERDSAYHQGSVWPWLLGQFANAHYRVYRNRDYLLHLLEPFAQHISEAGVGSISELFDGTAPHHPRGCIAQAWSVGEILRVLTDIRAMD